MDPILVAFLAGGFFGGIGTAFGLVLSLRDRLVDYRPMKEALDFVNSEILPQGDMLLASRREIGKPAESIAAEKTQQALRDALMAMVTDLNTVAGMRPRRPL